jgi:hypothetical protein
VIGGPDNDEWEATGSTALLAGLGILQLDLLSG